jgi:hypothetical protein
VVEHREIAEAFVVPDPGLADRRLVAHMQDAVARLGAGPSLTIDPA